MFFVVGGTKKFSLVGGDVCKEGRVVMCVFVGKKRGSFVIGGNFSKKWMDEIIRVFFINMLGKFPQGEKKGGIIGGAKEFF